MSFAKLAVAAGLAAVALSACGSSTQPLAGTITPNGKPIGRGRIDDPRTAKSNHVNCLRRNHVPVSLISIDGRPGIQIGSPPGGPTVLFEPTPGTAQGDQIQGRSQGAEVIGSALLYPNQGSDKELATIEDCLTKGVQG